MILVDTTVWVDFFRNAKTRQVATLKDSIQSRFDINICPIVEMEILQGIGDDGQYKRVKKQLDGLLSLAITDESYDLAGDIYRKARVRGFTIRKSLDCIIAAVAIQNRVQLLHNDKDFDAIEKVTTLHVFH